MSGRVSGRWRDRAAALGTLCLLLAGETALLLILAFIAKEAAPAWGGRSPADFLWHDPWAPLASPPKFGIFHAWVSTLALTLLALLVAVPLGLGIGVFTSEIAPPRLRLVLQPCLELLAGIPSVVYGFFGAVTLVKGFENWFVMPAGECLLVAGVVLGVMALPFVASTSAEALRALPAGLRETAAALGVTRWHAIRRILLPAAVPGLFAAVTLGLARAIGETLAVLMLAGNSVAPPHSLIDRGQPLTALVAMELGGTAARSEHYHALFAAGLMLFVVTALLHAGIWALRARAIRHG